LDFLDKRRIALKKKKKNRKKKEQKARTKGKIEKDYK
tara:strand:+ start:867 stop:977 length:111 start_codon:yes stop_codon:yes gene_type:complete